MLRRAIKRVQQVEFAKVAIYANIGAEFITWRRRKQPFLIKPKMPAITNRAARERDKPQLKSAHLSNCRRQ
jgi:hypothetical protein